MAEVFEHWTDVEIRKLLKRIHRCEYGLLLRFKNTEDLDYFKRKVYKLKVDVVMPNKVAMRLSPTDPKHELWLLKVTTEGKAPIGRPKKLEEEKVDGGEKPVPAEEVHD